MQTIHTQFNFNIGALYTIDTEKWLYLKPDIWKSKGLGSIRKNVPFVILEFGNFQNHVDFIKILTIDGVIGFITCYCDDIFKEVKSNEF